MMSNSTIFIFHTRKENQPQESKHKSTSSLSVLSSHHMDLEAAWFLSRREAFCNSPTLLDSIFSERFGEGGEGPALPELLRLPSSFRSLTGGIVSFSAIFATCHFWTSKILWWYDFYRGGSIYNEVHQMNGLDCQPKDYGTNLCWIYSIRSITNPMTWD